MPAKTHVLNSSSESGDIHPYFLVHPKHPQTRGMHTCGGLAGGAGGGGSEAAAGGGGSGAVCRRGAGRGGGGGGGQGRGCLGRLRHGRQVKAGLAGVQGGAPGVDGGVVGLHPGGQQVGQLLPQVLETSTSTIRNDYRILCFA